MDILIIAAQLILSLSILIVLHEFGHFLPARAFNIKVEKFYLFFDPWFSLFKRKIGETEWGIGWLPLGGYVKIAGMIDESMDTEQMKQPAQPWEFRSKPAWQRLIVMLGGVTVNFILGILIYSLVLYVWGETSLPTSNTTYGIYADSLAQKMGLQSGDKIIALDNEPVKYFKDIRISIFEKESKTIQIERNGQAMSLDIPENLVGELANYKGVFITPSFPCEIAAVAKKSPADSAGLEVGDKIIALNGQPINSFYDFSMNIVDYKSTPIDIQILRDQDTLNQKLRTTDEGKVGILAYPETHYFDFDTINYSLGASFPAGYQKSVGFLGLQINAFGKMFRGKVDASKSLGGFGTIAQMFGTEWDWRRFWYMTAVLSLILGFMNLLPIPALDGGHVMFLLYEVVTGRKPSDKFMEYATMVGFILILGLVLYANGLDILRAIRGE